MEHKKHPTKIKAGVKSGNVVVTNRHVQPQPESCRCPTCGTPYPRRACPTCPPQFVVKCKKCGTPFVVRNILDVGQP